MQHVSALKEFFSFPYHIYFLEIYFLRSFGILFDFLLEFHTDYVLDSLASRGQKRLKREEDCIFSSLPLVSLSL